MVSLPLLILHVLCSVHALHEHVDHLLHDDLLLCTTEESLAPMDDFLRASLPATVAPLVVTHLPELDVSQPDKVRCDCLL